MTFTQRYNSPMGGILLAADEIGLTGVWFDGQKYFARGLPNERAEQNTPVLSAARHWLDVYFTGREPDFMPPFEPRRFRISAGGMATAFADPIRSDHDLWCAGAETGAAAGACPHVRPGGGRRSRTQ